MTNTTNTKEYPKIIRITPNKIAKTLQVALGLEGNPLISIKKVKAFPSNSISVVFKHDKERYSYYETQFTIELYHLVNTGEKPWANMIFMEVKK